MPTPQKMEKLTKQARVLWPKYDPDLDTQVNGRAQIHRYIQEIYTTSKLDAEYVQLRKQKNLDDLIDAEVQRGLKNDVAAQRALKNKKDVNLNQAQILNVIETMYDVPESKPKANTKTADPKPSKPVKP